MVAQEMDQVQPDEITEQQLIDDQRVQHEYRELHELLEQIADAPASGLPAITDPDWWIDDPEVSRWLITLEGQVNLERVRTFRRSLLREEDVVDAQIISLEQGQIHIRVITNGGLPMGPLEHAVGKLTARSLSAPSR